MHGIDPWSPVPVEPDLFERLGRAVSVPRPVAELLVRRGYSSAESARRFLEPRLSDLLDPLLLPDMEPAVGILAGAIRGGKLICIYGDYDADGITASALMQKVLSALGARVSVFLPNRFDHGYGVTAAGLHECLAKFHPDVLLTVDCGTNSAYVLGPACDGKKVVVTDHHEPKGTGGTAYPVVNPCRQSSGTALAGVGVAFKVCHALLKHMHPGAGAKKMDLRKYLDLVAVGTVADVVPVTGENRILVHHGLLRMNREPGQWLSAVKEAARMEGPVGPYEIGFILGPRLNAAGRMAKPDDALRLLLESDPGVVRQLAVTLEKVNRERKETEDDIRESAECDLEVHMRPGQDAGLVAAGLDWHPGVIGIVAARLSNRHGCPVAVISLSASGGGKGSCRGPERGDLMAVLRSCAEYMDGYGGHRQAAGFTLKPGCLAAFRDAFRQGSESIFGAPGREADVGIDAWLDGLEEAGADLHAASKRIEPFGHGNAAPLWGIRNVRLVGTPVTVGRDSRHLRLRLGQGPCVREAIAFGFGGQTPPGPEMDIACKLRENTYQGVTSLQLQIENWREAECVETGTSADYNT